MNIQELIYHLRQCPDEILESSNIHVSEGVNTIALILDLYRKLMGDYLVSDIEILDESQFRNLDDNHLVSIQIGCWLFNHACFLDQRTIIPKINHFFFEALLEVCLYVKHEAWITDEDRIEEFIRIALKSCEILPEGESSEEASNNFSAFSSVERHGVLKQSNEAFERMLAIKKEMAERKAREAANTYGRE